MDLYFYDCLLVWRYGIMSHTQPHGSISSYIIGFILSLFLTLAAYFMVTLHLLTLIPLTIAILVLAVLQLLVQLIFFLHLGKEQGPRWHLVFFISTVGTVLLIVVASIWIMAHLNYNMMPSQMDQQIMKDEGIQR